MIGTNTKVHTSCSILLALLLPLSAQELQTDVKSHSNWHLLDRGEDCGHSADKIVGGNGTILGRYPWIARLGFGKPNDMDFICGGTIVNPVYILTSAFCVPSLQMQQAKARLGEYDTTTDPDCEDGGVCAPRVQDIEIVEYTCHQHFNSRTYQHDICLLRLASPIEFNNYVKPVCLPVYDNLKNNTFSSEEMELGGWGYTKEGSYERSATMRTMRVPVRIQAECQRELEDRTLITEKQLCAGPVCTKAESGNPLVAPVSINGSLRYFVIGILSFGMKDCFNTTIPDVYTKVPEFMNWILDNIRE